MRNWTEHGSSRLTAISDAGSTPAASTRPSPRGLRLGVPNYSGAREVVKPRHSFTSPVSVSLPAMPRRMRKKQNAFNSIPVSLAGKLLSM